MNSLAALRAAAEALPAEQYHVDRPISERGQYQRQLAVDFPIEINRLFFSARQSTRPLTWHTYLEIFVLLSRGCRRLLGDTLLDLSYGDVLIMDHLKLHAVVNPPGEEVEALVIRFMPKLVRSAASTASDLLLLLPFYCPINGEPHLVRATAPEAVEVHTMLVRLIESYASCALSPYGQPDTRAHFLVMLSHLARHFQSAERLRDLFNRQQLKFDRLEKIFTYVDGHYADKISLPQMATKAGMSPQRFQMLFKQAAGLTLVEYVTQVRLTHATHLLQETVLPIAEIAHAVGFCDQSYFDRRFKRHFNRSPSEFRKGS